MEPHSSFYKYVQPLVPRLRAAVLIAYEHAVDGLDPKYGAAEKHLGYELRDFITTELKRAPTEDVELVIRERGQQVWGSAGPWEIRWWRVGRTGLEDIWTCFPLNSKTAPMMVDRTQLALFPPEWDVEPDISASRKVVLAHRGNLETGCRAIDLCIPTRTNAGNKLSEWGFVYEVYRAPADELTALASGSPALTAVELAPAVEDGDLEFRPRAQPAHDQR